MELHRWLLSCRSAVTSRFNSLTKGWFIGLVCRGFVLESLSWWRIISLLLLPSEYVIVLVVLLIHFLSPRELVLFIALLVRPFIIALSPSVLFIISHIHIFLPKLSLFLLNRFLIPPIAKVTPSSRWVVHLHGGFFISLFCHFFLSVHFLLVVVLRYSSSTTSSSDILIFLTGWSTGWYHVVRRNIPIVTIIGGFLIRSLISLALLLISLVGILLRLIFWPSKANLRVSTYKNELTFQLKVTRCIVDFYTSLLSLGVFPIMFHSSPIILKVIIWIEYNLKQSLQFIS